MRVWAMRKIRVAPIMKNLLNPTLFTKIPRGPLKTAVAIYVIVMT